MLRRGLQRERPRRADPMSLAGFMKHVRTLEAAGLIALRQAGSYRHMRAGAAAAQASVAMDVESRTPWKRTTRRLGRHLFSARRPRLDPKRRSRGATPANFEGKRLTHHGRRPRHDRHRAPHCRQRRKRCTPPGPKRHSAPLALPRRRRLGTGRVRPGLPRRRPRARPLSAEKTRRNLREEGRFLDIVPNRRIVSAGTMHQTRCASPSRSARWSSQPRATARCSKSPTSRRFLDGRESPDDRQIGMGSGPRATHRFSSRSAEPKG